jgi:hypothetical protein
LFYLSPRFYFEIDLAFNAKVKAFGETLAAVGVQASLEGPDLWHIKGEFSFSILWWDKSVPFDESWGERQTVDAGTASLPSALQAELSNPDNVTPESPKGGAPVALAPAGGSEKLAHPLGSLAIRQRAVPLELVIDRLGTQRLAGGAQSVSVVAVALNGSALPHFQPATESFARGQFMDLSPDERLTGKVFETFPCGVVVGSSEYRTPDALARDVRAGFETRRLDPEPAGILRKWRAAKLGFAVPSHASVLQASKLGASARSERARERNSIISPLAASVVSLEEPPLALVDAGTLREVGALSSGAASSVTLASQQAAGAGQKVVEKFEVAA